MGLLGTCTIDDEDVVSLGVEVDDADDNDLTCSVELEQELLWLSKLVATVPSILLFVLTTTPLTLGERFRLRRDDNLRACKRDDMRDMI